MNLFFPAVFFLFGLVFGSFLNVCIYRLPRELSVVSPRSSCPGCSAPIAAYDNIPVLSWIILRGKCRNCRTRISPRYALVELLTATLFVLSYFTAASGVPGKPDFGLPGWSSIAEAVKLCALSFLLIGLIFTDAETKLLPDLLTKPGILLGLLSSLMVSVEGPAHFFLRSIQDWRMLSLLNSLAGAILGSGFILGIALLYEAVRGVEGMGRGDVKLMALIGAFLGVKQTLLVLLLGSFFGSCFGVLMILRIWRKRLARRRKKLPSEPPGQASRRAWQSASLAYRSFQIPFGVFLGTAALVSAFWGTALVSWYLKLYG